MSHCSSIFRQIYFKSTGYSFTHLGRLFLRLFVGMMLAQYGIRQLSDPAIISESNIFLPLVSAHLPLWLIISVEIGCSFLMMIGLFTRFMILPPLALMIVACHKVVSLYGFSDLLGIQMLSIPFMFMGIYFFLLLVGPGKISVDYFYSLYLINRNQDKDREEDLEEV